MKGLLSQFLNKMRAKINNKRGFELAFGMLFAIIAGATSIKDSLEAKNTGTPEPEEKK